MDKCLDDLALSLGVPPDVLKDERYIYGLETGRLRPEEGYADSGWYVDRIVSSYDGSFTSPHPPNDLGYLVFRCYKAILHEQVH